MDRRRLHTPSVKIARFAPGRPKHLLMKPWTSTKRLMQRKRKRKKGKKGARKRRRKKKRRGMSRTRHLSRNRVRSHYFVPRVGHHFPKKPLSAYQCTYNFQYSTKYLQVMTPAGQVHMFNVQIL